jgi:hypothetical protein
MPGALLPSVSATLALSEDRQFFVLVNEPLCDILR